MASTTYKVTGMDCGGCVKAVTRSITGTKPGADVQVDLAKGLVTVTGDITPAEVEDAVKIAGFSYEGVLA